MTTHPMTTSSWTHGWWLREQADRLGGRRFIVLDDLERSFREIYEESRAVAKALRAVGVRPGDLVGVLMPNCLDMLRIVFGTHLLRAVAVPVNARFKRAELSRLIPHSDMRILFTTQAIKEHVDFVALIWDIFTDIERTSAGQALSLKDAPELRHIVVTGGEAPPPTVSMEAFLARGACAADSDIDSSVDEARPDDVAYLLYTSGTTASPKGCELTHEAVLRAWNAYGDVIALTEESGLWSPCPFFHIGGLGPLASALTKGAAFLSMSHFEPESAVAMLEKYRPEHLFPAFPALTLGTLRSPAFKKERFEFIKTVLNVSPPDAQAVIDTLLPAGTVLLTDFGMTEASGIVTMSRPQDPTDLRIRSNGRALPGMEIKIVASGSTDQVETGVDGEICFRGINTLRSYYKDPVATSAAIDAQGWFHTGDRGHLDAHGCLHFVGRIKDMLKVGGENVAPAEIESYLSTHPQVKIAQVIGRPDDKYGEVAIAFVELLPGAHATADELIAHCRGHLANFKVPREVHFVTEWPMSATKIQKYRLAELL